MQGRQLRAVVVDDEPIARRILIEEIAEYPWLVVVGEADNGTRAVEVIQTNSPDLVFLDIQMPGCDGFEVLRRLGRIPPAVIFVTAFDRHAIRAFEAGAADYLLKPIEPGRFREAVERVRLNLSRNITSAQALANTVEAASVVNPSESAPASDGKLKRIVGKKGHEYFLLDLDQIYAFQAEGEVVWILTREKKFLASQTLRELTRRLEGTQFRRIHRGALVNVDHIQKMSSLSSNRWLVTMKNNLQLIVSKRLVSSIREVLHP